MNPSPNREGREGRKERESERARERESKRARERESERARERDLGNQNVTTRFDQLFLNNLS